MDISDRSPLLIVQTSLTIFTDRTALIGLIHRIHALSLGASRDSAQHFAIAFTATLLTWRNLKHKSRHLLSISLNALLKHAMPTFPAAKLRNHSRRKHSLFSEPAHQMGKSKGSCEQEL